MSPLAADLLLELVFNRSSVDPRHPDRLFEDLSPEEVQDLCRAEALSPEDRCAVLIGYFGAVAPVMLPEEAHLLGLGEEIIEACELGEQARQLESE